jgi:hypothetical protein
VIYYQDRESGVPVQKPWTFEHQKPGEPPKVYRFRTEAECRAFAKKMLEHPPPHPASVTKK